MRKLCVFLVCFALTLCCVTFSVRADDDIALYDDSSWCTIQTRPHSDLTVNSSGFVSSGSSRLSEIYSSSSYTFTCNTSYSALIFVCAYSQFDSLESGYSIDYISRYYVSPDSPQVIPSNSYVIVLNQSFLLDEIPTVSPTPTLTPSPSPVPTVAPDVNYKFVTDDYPYIVIFLLGVLVCLTLFKR